MSFSGGRTTDESRNLTDGNFDSKFETDRDEASWQNDFTIGTSHLLTLGYDYRHDRVTSSRDYDETERDNHAAFGQWQWTGEAVDTEVSVRHDDNEAFGTESTGSLAGGIRVAEATRVFASYGTGFKTPTFNDLYYPDTAFFESNPDLDPEHSRSLELGARGSGSVSWNASLYRTEIENLIVNVDPDGFGGQPGSPENVREAEINGLELGIQGEHGGWDLGANATLLDTEIVTSQGGANDGNELPRRPERKFTFDFARPIGPVRLSAHIQHESDRFDDAANTTELEGFTRVDFALDYRVTQGLELRAGVENLSDADYQTADGFETPGRTARLRLSYRM
jgi:vitamin B12 transporter